VARCGVVCADAGGGVNACGGDNAAAAADYVLSRDADGGLDSRLIGAAARWAGVALIGHCCFARGRGAEISLSTSSSLPFRSM
jgi:hypothetical protein